MIPPGAYRGKSWRTQETLLNYPKVYYNYNLSEITGRKKENMETEKLRQLAKRSHIFWCGKKSRHRPWIFFLVFCCISNMLFRWVTSSLIPSLERTPKISARKLSSHYIFVAAVQLPVFTSSRLVDCSPKNDSSHAFNWCPWDGHPLSVAPHMHTRSWNL